MNAFSLRQGSYRAARRVLSMFRRPAQYSHVVADEDGSIIHVAHPRHLTSELCVLGVVGQRLRRLAVGLPVWIADRYQPLTRVWAGGLICFPIARTASRLPPFHRATEVIVISAPF